MSCRRKEAARNTRVAQQKVFAASAMPLLIFVKPRTYESHIHRDSGRRDQYGKRKTLPTVNFNWSAVAAGLVIIAFCMKDILSLRVTALISNVAFSYLWIWARPHSRLAIAHGLSLLKSLSCPGIGSSVTIATGNFMSRAVHWPRLRPDPTIDRIAIAGQVTPNFSPRKRIGDLPNDPLRRRMRGDTER
jgi:hypothetical protein